MAVAGDGIGVSPRVAAMTTSRWLPRVSDQAYENYPLLDLLRKKKRARRTSAGGGEIRWMLSVGYPALQTFEDGAPHSFVPTGKIKNAVLPFAFYRLTEALSPREKAENRGAAAKGQLVPTVTRRLQDGAVAQLGPELYVDGNATGNGLKLQGLESMFGHSDTQTANDELATTLNDTYAGLSTAYGSVGSISGATQATRTLGAWAWSPSVVAVNRTPTGGSQLTWDDNCDSLIRLGVRSVSWGAARMDQPDLGVFREPSHRALLEKLESTHRVMLTSSDLETRYGFKPAGGVNFEGVVCYWDRAVPSTDGNSNTMHGYLLNTDKMMLEINPSGVTGAVEAKGEADLFDFWQGQDIYTLQDVYALLMFGQMQFESPRFFAKFTEIVA